MSFFDTVHTLPRPSGTPEPTLWEKFVLWLPDPLVNGVKGFIAFVDAHIGIFIVILLIILAIKFTVDHYYRQQKQIERLWLFILFFLSKRQMMIPLVVTLAKRDAVLPEKTLQELLEIRDACRAVSLRKSPRQRMNLERKVSKILFEYFQKLEAEGHLKSDHRLDHVAQDLEFIDTKLVQLQKVYNQEVAVWNDRRSSPLWGGFFRVFRFTEFEPFAAPK